MIEKRDKRLRLLVTIQVVSLILGFGALITAVVVEHHARVVARFDTCRLLVGLVEASVMDNPKQQAAAHYYIEHTKLRNCYKYSNG